MKGEGWVITFIDGVFSGNQCLNITFYFHKMFIELVSKVENFLSK